MGTTIKRMLLLTGVAVLTATTVWAQEQRVHFAATRPGHVIVYTATLITNLTEQASERTLLLESVQGDRLIVSNRRDFVDQTDTYTFADADGATLFRAMMQYPFKAQSKSETATEARALVAKGTKVDIPIDVHAGRLNRKSKESDWSDDATSKRLRAEVRAQLPPGFAAELAHVKHLFAAPELSDFCLVLSMMEEGVCSKSQSMGVAYTTPDCAFDASFGKPCSPAQLSRAETAKATKNVRGY